MSSLKLLRARTTGQHHLLPLLLYLVSGFLLRRSASASTVVTHLPGFDGPLPFYLETGYVGVEEETGAELFYYFVESERSVSTDPVILWLTGGPRCSVFCGLAFEVGPVKFVVAPYTGGLPQLVQNPLSWTKMASILFLDSPVGSGFSYARDPKGYNVGDYSSSLQVQTFLNKWFTDHPQYLSNPFYVGGDSYAGMVVPLIAQYISEGIEKRQQPLINLKDAIKSCKGDYVNPANELCAGVLRKIENLISEVLWAHILYKKCILVAPKPSDDDSRRKFLLEESTHINTPPSQPDLDCLTYSYYLAYFWMNNNLTRNALGIKKETIGEWIKCTKGLPYTFDMPSSIPYHLNVTTRGYRALVYSGDHDLVVPLLGTQAWIRFLKFSIIDDWRAWHLGGQAAGFTIAYANNLTFATIKGGGHTGPEYRPKECFAMARRWLDNEPL